MDRICVSPQYSYIEALTLSTVLFAMGPLGGLDEMMRVGRPELLLSCEDTARNLTLPRL